MSGKRFSKEELANGPPEKVRAIEVCYAVDSLHDQQIRFKEIVYAHVCELHNNCLVLYIVARVGERIEMAAFRNWLYWKDVTMDESKRALLIQKEEL